MTDGAKGALRADLNKSTTDIASMFDHVAQRYDLMDTLMTGGMDRVWMTALRKAVAPRPGERILDVAAGTGISSAALAAGGAEVVACDISEGMIEVGRQRHPEIEFVQGNAMDLDFEEASFDAVTISWGLRNIPDPAKALREMVRVVRPRGRLVVCEFSTPPNKYFRSLYTAYQSTVMPVLAKVASSDDVAYDYLVESIRDWPDQVAVGQMIRDNGWAEVEYRNLTGGIAALHRARKPLP
ncbi:class I SAM-dependent methyltransferase [Schaalia vaccimaxillae]|uniref:class I SAM-dependent methyltransferase n=1 Tax=Schaalia vaccimaxillae TaxID=183916 RepID=UPI0003B6F317|nr:class I SAM-dependent methyltransferase [Schaalia vaccimaxillae]